MPLTVLSDDDIRSLLISFKKEDIDQLQDNLCEALHDFSTGTQETTQGCSSNQPKRLAMAGQDGKTTLIMPASTNTSRGIKTVTMTCPNAASPISSMRELSLNSTKSSTSGRQSPGPQPPSRASTISSDPSVSDGPSLSKTSSTGSASIHYSKSHTPSIASSKSTEPSLTSNGSSTNVHATPKYDMDMNPRGSLTLMTATGLPYAFLAAEELTAFRTALAATVILKKRDKVHSITVFGAGLQARWHIRLALLLRGTEIHHIDIINRSFARAKGIMHDFYQDPSWASLREANPKLQFSIVSSEYKEYAQHAKDHIRKADVIFCCTPATSPLFPHEVLTHNEGRKKGRYISAIGSYRPHMCELAPEILHQAVSSPASQHNHHHHLIHHKSGADQGGVVIVDSLDSALREAGEIVQAGLSPEQLVEVGELIMIRKSSMREIELGIGEGEKGLRNWLQKGNVIYKSVGIGCMDVCVGEDLVMRANERGLGTTIHGF